MQPVTAIFNWIIKNLSNIFSLIGISLTLYLGIFYVPQWIKDNETEKVHNAKYTLEQSVKELAYSDSLFTFKNIEILFQAKESEFSGKLPFSIDQILTESQGSFMNDKFLPLQVRKHLIEKIELVKSENPPKAQINKSETDSPESTDNKSLAFILASILGALTAGITGIISFYKKVKSENANQEEVSNEIIEASTSSFDKLTAQEYEKAVINEIKSYPNVEIIINDNQMFDLTFRHQGKIYYVEIKYLSQSSIGISSFQRFVSTLLGLEGEFWFIYNTGVTTLVRKRAYMMQSENRNIELVHAPNLFSLKRKLAKLLN